MTIARPRCALFDMHRPAAVFLGLDFPNDFDAIGGSDEVGDDASARLHDELAAGLECSIGLRVFYDNIVQHKFAVAAWARTCHSAQRHLEIVSAVVADNGAWP